MERICERVGHEIQLISKSEVRYTGILNSYDRAKDVVVIGEAKAHGTEHRESPIMVPGSDQVYEYIVFKRSNMSRIGIDRPDGRVEWIEVKSEDPLPCAGPARSKEEAKPAPEEQAGRRARDLRNAHKGKPWHPAPQGRKDKRSLRGRSLLLEKASIPDADYDFAGNNSKMGKARPDTNKRALYYNRDVSFFDNIS